MKTVTFQANVYKADYHCMAEIESGEQMPYVFNFENETLVKIGTAVVTITLFDNAKFQEKELERLNKKLADVRADNQHRENAILDRISKLQAIGYEAQS
jgi:hypothetical protein